MVDSPAEVIRPLRRNEYDALVALGVFQDERVELLDGALVAMSPVGPPHSSAVQKLTELLLPRLLGRATVRVQSPFAAHDLSEPEPDVAVVPPGDYHAAHPRKAYLVIEVADSSLQTDRSKKAAIYAECGIPEYWIVNLAQRCVEVHTDPIGASYRSVRQVGHEASLCPVHFADLQLRVADFLK